MEDAVIKELTKICPPTRKVGWPGLALTRLRAAGCVFAEDEARLLISAARTPADLAAMVDRRAAGLPLQHVLGWAEFCGLRIAVNAGVFVLATAPIRMSSASLSSAGARHPRTLLRGGGARSRPRRLRCGRGHADDRSPSLT